jgi:hypothetical protein
LALLVALRAAEAARAPEASAQKRYVGAVACRDCHEEQYDTFSKYALKSRSYDAVAKLAARLTPEELPRCYGCHTTGYGKPGGFQSLAKTPQLVSAACEVCHGPGSAHVESRRRADIVRKPDPAVCATCHREGDDTPRRAIAHRPMRYAGAH